MDTKEIIPSDYEQQVRQLLDSKKSPVIYINGVKTIALWTKSGFKPYVEVAERERILYERIKSKEIESFEMLASEPGEVQDVAYWQVRICIDGHLFIGSSQIHIRDAKPDSADAKDCIGNAETSAYGRALGHANLGTFGSLASYDEMRQAGFTSNLPVVEEISPEVQALQARFKAVYGATSKWSEYKKFLKLTRNGAIILDSNLTPKQLETIDKALQQKEQELKAKEAGGSNG